MLVTKMRNKARQELYEDKLRRIDTIKNQLELADGIGFSIEDINDAYLEAKINDLENRINQIVNQLSHANSRSIYQQMNQEIENLEEIIYLLNKKHSKTYLKAKKMIGHKNSH